MKHNRSYNFLKSRAGGRTPPTRRSGGGSRMLRGLMLGRVKIFWARADVWRWRLLFEATTKEKKSQKRSPENWGPIVVVRGGGSCRLAPALLKSTCCISISTLKDSETLQETHQDSERELSLQRHCTRTIENAIDSCINSATVRFLQRRLPNSLK